MSLIPVDPDEIPTSPQPRFKPLDESLTYYTTLKNLEEVDRVDKNGNRYFRAAVEVIAPEEFKGRRIFDNYIRKPFGRKQLAVLLGREPNHKELEDLETKNARFWQLFHCFSIPIGKNGIETDAGLGREGHVTIKNEEYPAGSGDIRSRINDYLNPKEVRK